MFQRVMRCSSKYAIQKVDHIFLEMKNSTLLIDAGGVIGVILHLSINTTEVLCGFY
jgi:hypothetical protein